VFISSHLLDEVERTCDAAAIVDRGRVITQGLISEIADGGAAAHRQLIVGVDDVDLALSVLSSSEHVHEARRSDEGIRVELADGPQSAALVNAALVHAGIGVARLEPVRQSLEQRFLQVTSRLNDEGSPQADGVGT